MIEKKTQIPAINNILVLLLLLTSSLASRITNSNYFFVSCIIIAGIQFIKLRLKFDKGFILLFLGYLVLTALYFIKFGYVEILASIRFFFKILFSYLVIKITGIYFFESIEKVVYYLSAISLFIFGFQYFSPNAIFGLNNIIMDLFPVLKEQEGFRNDSWIFFNFNYEGLGRNSGFMWEPGAFAAILVISMLIAITRSKLKINKQIIIFSLALFSTFSTTGFISLGIVAIYIVLNINKKALLIIIPVMILIGFYISTLDFITPKIIKQYSTRNNVINYASDYTEVDIVSLGRFGSMVADFEDFKKNPLIGIGLQNKEQGQSIYNQFVHTNGLTIYLVMFGLFGFLFFIYNVTKTFGVLTKHYNVKGAFVFTTLILIVSFSNPVLVTPLFLSFQIGYLAFNKPNRLTLA